MDIFLVYLLLPVFFLGLIPVLWLVLQEREPETSDNTDYTKHKPRSSKETTADKAASYGLLSIILAFMLILTVLIRRGQR